MKNLNLIEKTLALLFLLCLLPLGISAQGIVRGLVNDETGEPVIGATIRVVGTSDGTVTDLNGRFEVKAKPTAQLSVSYIGYITENINVGGRKDLVVTLKTDSKTLSDVVVVGYGTMKKSDISGSVATVDRDAVMKRIPTNIGQALQGSAAGVMVTQQDGSPDGNSAIRIRGVGTINGDASPLYVVDGVQVGNNANFVNPSDIESIEILKDASATAIYGSAGANGVVMITTKRGGAGKAIVTFTADYGLQTLPAKLDVLDIDGYTEALREAKKTNDGDGIGNAVWDPKFDGKRNYIDWQKEMTRAALRQQYGTSITGGSEKTDYNLSFGYLDVKGMVVNTSYKRFTSHANINSKVNSFLEIGGDINYTHSESHGSNGTVGNNGNLSSIRDFATMTPTLDYVNNNDLAKGELINVNLQNPDGTYGVGYQLTPDGWEGNTAMASNVYAMQMENGERGRNGFDRIQTTAYVDLSFLNTKQHKLNLKSQGTYTYAANNGSDYTGGRKRYNLIGGKMTEVTLRDDQDFAFSLNNSHNYTLGLQTYLTYTLNYNIHNLTLMIGNEVSKSWGQWVSAAARKFPSEFNRSLSLTEDPNSKNANGGYNADTRMVSYFARTSYVLLDRYILTGTVRKDGSSNFGTGNRWGTFPSLAGAWRISEEPFMRDVKFVDNFKFRVGWGQTGNAGNMAGKAIVALSGDAAYAFYGPNGISGYWGNRNRETGWYAPLVDPNLKWETTEMTNFGIDFAFLNNWDITLDYFIKDTKDLLLSRQIRSSAGYTQIYTNYGEIENKGFEFVVGYHKQVNRDFGFNVRVTGSTLKNKVKKMGEPLYNTCSDNGAGTLDGSNVQAVLGTDGVWTNHSICKEGEAVGSFFGFLTDGIIKDEADLNEYQNRISDNISKSDTNHPLSVGDMKFKDLNGDNIIDQKDMTIIGNGFPKLNYGINVGANYKNWDLNLYMYGVLGQDILSYSAMRLSNMAQFDEQWTPNILKDAYKNAWRNGQGSLPRLTFNDANRNGRVSDLWVKNGDFLRISNLQVGYTLPQQLTNKLYIQKARVYMGVQNLLTISAYNKYGDPEVGQGSVLYTGLDTGRYPMPRTFMAGVNVTF